MCVMGDDVVDPRRERFQALYTEHRTSILGYCMRRIGPTDAADACSETFLVAWRRLDDIPDAPKTLPYLYGIAARVLSNQVRSSRRRRRLDAKLKHLGVISGQDVSTIVVGHSGHDDVIAALHKLRPKDREIVLLHNWEDLSRETIAEMLGMTKAAIDQRLHRSYRRLAGILEKERESKASILPGTMRSTEG